MLFWMLRYLVPLFLVGSLCAGVGLDPDAKHRGEQGLRISAGAAPFEVIADSEQPVNRVRLRFYVRLRDLGLDEGTVVTLFRADQVETPCFAVTLGLVEGVWRLGWQVAEHAGEGREVTPALGPTLGAGWHAVEFAWQAGEGSGSFQLWLNDVAQTPLEQLNNGLFALTLVRLGLPGVEAGAFRGNVDFDSVVWRDRGEVGRVPFSTSQIVEHTSAWPSGHSVLFLTGLISETTTVVLGKTHAGSRQPLTPKDGFHER